MEINKAERRTYRIVFIFLLALAAAAAFYIQGRYMGADTAGVQPQAPSLTVDEQAAEIVAGMTPEEKIGQMVMMGVQGTAIDADTLKMLQEYSIGGVIFFDRNMESKMQVQGFTQALQEKRAGRLPLFVAVDEEGGEVARMKQEWPPPPSARELGMQENPALAEQWAERTGAELKEMGFNMNFAPVADLGLAPQRSYSQIPAIVSAFVQSVGKGYERENIVYTLKHFPGIGKGQMDSHVDASRINAEYSQLAAEDLQPFHTMISDMDADNYLIMVSHLTYTALDADNPASLSYQVITGLLRQKMGYQGLVITDDMEMGAVSRHYAFRELGVKAVQAGADMVLVCHVYEHEAAVYKGLLEALRNGGIKQERIDESVRRIVKMKLLHLI